MWRNYKIEIFLVFCLREGDIMPYLHINRGVFSVKTTMIGIKNNVYRYKNKVVLLAELQKNERKISGLLHFYERIVEERTRKYADTIGIFWQV